MCWVKKTKDDVRIIGADDLLKMIVLIDAAHAVHDDMREVIQEALFLSVLVSLIRNLVNKR